MIQELQNLPEVSFISDMSVDDVQKQLIADYEAKLSELKGTEVHLTHASRDRMILNAAAVILYQGMQYVDRAGKQNLLKYTYDAFLDNVAALKGIKREEAKPATVKVKFSLSEARGVPTSIPIGTRVTADGEIYFETTEYTEIAAGSLCTEVEMKCTEPGTQGNKFEIGEIRTLVDPIQYVSGVTNTAPASGGSDTEDDESLRERVYLAPSAYSVAGPEAAYIFHAKSFSTNIVDVKVYTNQDTPGVVYICFLLENGIIPTDDMIEKLESYLENENIKPLTDKVVVEAPTAFDYEIELTYYISRNDAPRVQSIKNAVTESIDKFIDWQSQSLGRDINPSKLTELLMGAGVKRVAIEKPSYQVLTEKQVAKLSGAVTVNYGGLEDD